MARNRKSLDIDSNHHIYQFIDIYISKYFRCSLLNSKHAIKGTENIFKNQIYCKNIEL